jgi:hypothetical protein
LPPFSKGHANRRKPCIFSTGTGKPPAKIAQCEQTLTQFANMLNFIPQSGLTESINFKWLVFGMADA